MAFRWHTDNSESLGAADYRWTVVYSTSISDGTNSATVANIKTAINNSHVAATQGDGISITEQVITNSDRGSVAVSSHNSTYDHTKLHDRQHPMSSASDHTGFSTDTTLGGANPSDEKVPSEKAIKTYADGLVVGLIDDRGNYDASGNTWPATGGSGTGGAILKGDLWMISVGGTLGGTTVEIGTSIRALVDTPGQTAGNWNILTAGLGYVAENQANKSTDATMGGETPSDTLYPSQSAVNSALNGKSNTGHTHAGLHNAATAATSGGVSVGGMTGQEISIDGSSLDAKTPVDGDGIIVLNSVGSWLPKFVSFANAWANYFKAKADALYALTGHNHKLDDLTAPDDNTDLDASTSKHGLLPKLGGGTTNFLRADGTWAAAGGSWATLDSYESNTAGSGSPNVLTTAETHKVLANTGSTAKNYESLPTAAANLYFSFYVTDTDGMRITADTNDKIYLGGVATPDNGYIETTTQYSRVNLRTVEVTAGSYDWVDDGWDGIWTVSS